MTKDKGCPEYPAYVPYLSWGQKISDYRNSRDADTSQVGFAKSVGINLKQLQDLESDKVSPTYDEHQIFANTWCGGDIEQWWVRDQGFPPSTPGQDKKALRNLRRDYKKDKAKLNRYRHLLIEMLTVSLISESRDIGRFLLDVYKTLQEFNDGDLFSERLASHDPEDYLGLVVHKGHKGVTVRQIKTLNNSLASILKNSDKDTAKRLSGLKSRLEEISNG